MTRKNESDFACQASAGTPLPQSEGSPSSEPKAPKVITDESLDIQAYRQLLECSHMAILFIAGPKPIYCNSVVLELLGMTREEVLSKTVEEVSPPFQPNGQSSHELAMHLYQQTMSRKPQIFEWRYRRKDGSEFDAEVTLTRMNVAGIDCVAAAFRDITERKASEQALRESEARFRYLADKLPIQIQLVDVGGRYNYNNQAIRDFFGLGFNELLSDWKQWVHPDDLEVVRKGTEHPPGQPPPEGFEFRIRNVQGQYRWLWALAVPRRTDDGQLLGYIVTAVDITDRKATEQALRQSESTLKSLFQAAPVGLVLMKNRVAYSVNERICDIIGRSAAELIGQDTRSLYENDEEYERVGKGLYETLWDKGSCYVETRLKRSDGTFRDVSMFCAPVDLANREAGVAIAVQDITEKRKADEALRESEARFRYLADKLPFHIQLIDVEGRAIYVNQSIRDFFGLGPSELLGPWKHLVHPEDMEAVRKGTEHPPGQPLPQGFEFRLRNVQGEYRWLWALRVPRRTSDGQLLGYITSAVDITDRKQAEQAVRSREGMLRSLFQAVPVGLVLMHHRILDTVNDRMCEITGYAAEQMVGQKSRMLFESDEEYLRVGRGLYDQLWERGSSYVESRYMRPDGTFRDVSFFGAPVDPANPDAGVAIAIQDITEMKQAQEAIRASENTRLSLFKAAPVGLALMKGRYFNAINDRVGEITGYAPEQLVGQKSTMLYESQEEYMRVGRAIYGMLWRRGSSYIESRFRRSDGTFRDVSLFGAPVDPANPKAGVAVAIQDITDIKKAQEAVRASESTLQSIFQAVPVGVVLMKDRVFNSVNERMCEFSGRAAEELIGHNSRLLYESQEVYESVGKALYEELWTRGSSYVETRFLRPDGTFREVSLFGAPLNPTNPEAGVAIAIQDITEMKKAQEAVRSSEFNLRSLFQTVPVGVVLIRDRVFRSVNGRFCEITGRPVEGLVGHDARILYDAEEEYARVGKALYEELWEHGSSYVETRFLRPDGTFRDVSLFGAPVDPAHREAGVAVAIQDITEQHKADAALRESEERFRMLADKLPIQIQLLNEEGQSVYVNQNIRDFYGLQDDLPGESWVRLAHPEDREALVHALHDDETVDTISRIEFRIQNVHGEYRWLWAMRIPRYTSSGQRIGFITVGIDITDRKKAEEAMRSSVSTLRGLVQAVPVGVALLKDRIFQSVNEQMCEIAGRSASQLIGQSTRLVYESDEEFERIGQELYRSLQEHGIRRLETRILRPDGTLRDVSFSGTLLDSAQPEEGVVIAIEDITERKAAERERHYLQSQLLQSQKMEAVGQLAGGVAHDFNNILAAFLLHLGLLQSEPGLSPEIQAELSDLETEANRASTLTRQLLLFSRRHVTQLHVLDVNSLVGNLLKMLRRLIGEHVFLEFEGAPEALWINADGGMIEQVVLNLVVNARDAMPQGGRITLKTTSVLIGEEEAHLRSPEARAGRHAVISVCDTGCGIEPEVLQHIFEPFFTTKAPGKGTGLGLSAVHGIVAQHHGWVNVQSKPGEGSAFSVHIPECESPVNNQQASGASGAVNLPGGTETILLVEDDPALCRSTSMILRRRGYQIIEAPDAATALELWKTRGPEVQLLLTDMIMPGGMTGLELIQTLHKAAPNLRVILMSGYSAEMVDNGLPMPEQALYLAKPFNSQTLLLKVREQLDRR